MALQLRKLSTFSCLTRNFSDSSSISATMLKYRTMQKFSCSPYSPFSRGARFRKTTHPNFTDISVNLTDSYISHIPVSICSHLPIWRLCSPRNTFEFGNCIRLNSVAHELMRTRSFSSKRKKKVPCRIKSKGAGDDAVSEGKRTGDGLKKRDKSTVCNSVNGQISAAVSTPKPSIRKSNAKPSKLITSSTLSDAKSKEKAAEDGLAKRQSAKSNAKVKNVKAPAKRNPKPKKNQDEEKVVQESIDNEGSAKNIDKAQSAKPSVKRNQKPRNNKQDKVLSSSSSTEVEVKSSKKTSEDKATNSTNSSHITTSNVLHTFTGDSKVKKIGPLYPPSGKSVVVVESVTKARVIQNYLGDMYEVLPSYGHVRDLAGRSGSVRPDDDFSMVWEVPASAWTHLKSIKVALNGAKKLILASDPDREGEAIAWHITEMLQQQDALSENTIVARVVFHEITESSIKSALQAPRDIDRNLVNAYLARRALDYLIGFNISPLLWRKLPGCQSAGRVQSAALALICDREMEIEKFNKKEYWTIGVDFHNTCLDSSGRRSSISSHMTHFNSQKLDQLSISSSAEARDIEKRINCSKFEVSQDAAEDINSFVKERYGDKFASKSVRRYFKKVKNAQEAHEAIRPTNIRRLPETLMGILDDDSQKLYKLIWTRTMACQMEPSTSNMVQVDIGNTEGDMVFRSVASRVGFPGYQEVYEDRKATGPGSEDKEREDNESDFEVLYKLKAKDSLSFVEVDLQQHYTKPPPRYSEGALVKKLEELGIGRPSTYASIMKVLQDRNYITMKGRVLHPEFRGRMVSAFLSHHFSEVADYSFTADMENELDNVSAGETEWKGLLKDYWSRFSKYCDLASNTEIRQVEKMLEKRFDHYLFAGMDSDSRVCPSCSVGTLRFKVSRFGSGYFIGCDEYPKCKHTAMTIYSEEDEDVPSEKLEKSFPPRILGNSPGSDEKIFLKKGPYGYYVQLGEDRKGYSPKRSSLAEVKDIDSVNLEDAIELLQYPVTLGKHPDDQHPVILRHSKSGFSVKHRRTVAPVPKNMDPKKVTLENGLKLLSSKTAKKSGRPKSKPKTEEEASWE
ncbi:uncharacterized protein A4U43_C01F5750 [Asparagus officinalis]|uniref:DNA topoisomerase n=1 Tax=Asparagus officinalis TaxID=4686 RepID=A0A5P1FMB7_ASPOF|nr:uncharacterized protein A4U43_C01F5750 [Asparagus officinalis]